MPASYDLGIKGLSVTNTPVGMSRYTTLCAEQDTFGKLFINVSKCRRLMKEKQMIASGSSLLQAIRPNFTWVENQLNFFASKDAMGSEGVLHWHDYMSSEGYLMKSRAGECIQQCGTVSIPSLFCLN